MERLKKLFFTVFSIVCEHITLFVAVIGCGVIVISSQIWTYTTRTLLLWIIFMLGLIATAIASEKYFKLNRIEKNILHIKKSIDDANANIDVIFFTRKESESLEERMKNAKTIFISGGSLSRLSDEYYAFFEQKLKENCELEIIMVKPFTQAADLLCKNVVYEIRNYEQYSRRIEESLERFLGLQKQFPSLVVIRLVESVPPFGIVAVNLKRNNANMKVELYSYTISARDRMQFSISRRDRKIFDFLNKQIKILRENSKIVTRDNYTFHTN